MIKDLGLFSWRIGLVLIIGMPLLYITAALAPFAVSDGDHPFLQLILNLQMIIPYIFLSIGIGCALCLLVRIEMHLRANRKDV